MQGFFLHFIETRAFARADPQRGRFRAFLLGSFTRYMASEWERNHTQKRGGHRELVSLDTNLIEAGGLPELATAATPERAFEESWALTVVERAMAQLAADAHSLSTSSGTRNRPDFGQTYEYSANVPATYGKCSQFLNMPTVRLWQSVSCFSTVLAVPSATGPCPQG